MWKLNKNALIKLHKNNLKKYSEKAMKTRLK